MSFDANWAETEKNRRRWLAENGMYRQEDEHAS